MSNNNVDAAAAPVKPLVLRGEPAAQRFLELLAGSADAPACWRLIHDRDKNEDAIKHDGAYDKLMRTRLENAQAEGFAPFVVVNEGGQRAEDIKRVRALFVDLDGAPLPRSWHYPPHVVVETSPGRFHAYWLVRDLAIAEFESAQRRLAAHYGGDATVCDLPRVMRVPGYLHQKGRPHRATLADHTGGEPRHLVEVPAADVLAGLPADPARVASAPTGEPTSLAHFREVLSYIDPTFSGGDGDWVGMAKALRWGQLPVLGLGEQEDRDDLLDDWCSGALWRERTGDEAFAVATYGSRDVLMHRTSDRPREGGGVVGFGTFIHYARKAGYAGPPSRIMDANIPAANDPADDLSGVTFGELSRRDAKPVEYLSDGFVRKSVVNFLSGPGGVNKSRLAVQLGLCINAGVDAIGRKTQRARFVYVSAEDDADEVTRRTQAITRKLKLPGDSDAVYLDRYARNNVLAKVSEGGGVEHAPFYDKLRRRLAGIAGHKFVVLDSCYDFVEWRGNAKVDEGAVRAFIRAVLDPLGAKTDSTLLVLWHPSRTGIAAGDMAGWSVAWENAPRSKLTLSAVEGAEDAYELRVGKANAAKKGLAVTLYWDGGALLPRDGIDDDAKRENFQAALVRAAIQCAETGMPIRGQSDPPDYVYEEVEKACGRRPSKREIKKGLQDAALRDRTLEYVRGTNLTAAGYYPPGRAVEMARRVRKREDQREQDATFMAGYKAAEADRAERRAAKAQAKAQEEAARRAERDKAKLAHLM